MTTPTPVASVRLARTDNEFLPAALEILETPLSPVRSAMILTLCAMAATAVIWAYLSRIDIIAVAQGKIQPIGRTKVIEPLETGRVRALLGVNGRHVHAGETLLQLDDADKQADLRGLENAIASARAEASRRQTALKAAGTRVLSPVPEPAWPPGLDEGIASRERAVLVGDLAQLSSMILSYRAQQQQKMAERERLNATIEAQNQLVSTLKERVDMRNSLLTSSSGSKASVIDAEETYRYHATNLAMYRGQLGEIKAALDSVQADIDKVFATFTADNSQKLAAAQKMIQDSEDKLEKVKVEIGYATLRSPIDGVVQGSTVTSIGQVVTTGEQIMEVVPESGGLEIEAYLQNQDVGFVSPGQLAVIKVESFPFTTYGTLNARVKTVGFDAIPINLAERSEGNPTAAERAVAFGGAQRTQNLVYPVTLDLDGRTIKVGTVDTALIPGMSVTVEIRTGTRRILEFLFSPIIRVASTTFRER